MTPPLAAALESVSLVSANFGNAQVYRRILLDWFEFLGGKPGEVVVVDGGSDLETQTAYWQLFQDNLIDKLQLIQPHHPDNNKDSCYIQEYTAGAIASKPYLMWFKIDTLPYREGHACWLAEAIAYLDRDDTFAVGGSFNASAKHHDAWDGWYFSEKCSENFSLMTRQTFVTAMQEFAGTFIASGFRGTNPAAATGQGRYLLEVAFERYMQRHKKYTLVRIEDPTWTVFHTNVAGERLAAVRNKYRARKAIDGYLNAGLSRIEHGGRYYGQPLGGGIRRVRVRAGRSWLGPYWRALKRLIGLPS